MSAHAPKLPVCPNCATDLGRGENFCPTCGQPNHDVNVTFGHVVEEVLEGVLHFDSKVWLTFRELIARPGKLTVDFLAGRRARFVPPIRLYIFLSLVFFFLLNQQKPEVFNMEFSNGPSAAAAQKEPSPDSTTARRELQGLHADTSGVVVQFGGEKIDIDRDVLQNKPLMARLAAGNVETADSVLRLTGQEPSWWRRVARKSTSTAMCCKTSR